MAGKEFTPPQTETYLLFVADPSKWRIDKEHEVVFGKQYTNPYTNTHALLFPWCAALSKGEKIIIKFRPRYSSTPGADPMPHPLSVLFPSEIEVQQVVREYFPAENLVRTYGLCGQIHNGVMTAHLLLELGRLEVFYSYGDNHVRFGELLSKAAISLSASRDKETRAA